MKKTPNDHAPLERIAVETAHEIARRFVSDSYQHDLELAILRHFEARTVAQQEALKEAERFLEYFTSEGPRSFVGPGTPKSCLAAIRAALGKNQQ